MSATVPSPAAAGATQGMQPAHPAVPQLQSVALGVTQVVQHLRATPGVDQAKLEQGVALMKQGLGLIVSSTQRGPPA